MTQISRPFDGVTTGDAGPYSSSNWRDAWAAMLHAWAHGTGYGNRGPIIDSGSAPNVGLRVQATSPASAAVDVLEGAALVEGGLYLSDATETLAIAANSSGNPRIDTIILRKDDIAQTIRLVVKQGTPAVTPTPPALTQTAGTMWEIPLCDVDVANGFVSISDNDLNSRAEWANAADGIYLKDILNNSGGTLETGDVVIWDSTTPGAVTTTISANHPYPAGTWVGRTANGDYGRVLNRGVGLVKCVSAFAAGTSLQTGFTAAQARSTGSATRQNGNLGFLLEASPAQGVPTLAFIDAQRRVYEKALYSYTLAQNTTGPTFTTGADRTVPLNTEEFDPGEIGALSGNQVTLGPGTYTARGEVSISGDNFTGYLRLWNATGGTELGRGNNFHRPVGNATPQIVTIETVFTIGATSAIELRIRVVTTNTAAHPAINLAGVDERYVTLKFEKW